MDASKIIKGAVSNGRYTVTAPIVKEDYGLYLKIEGVELPSTYEVDFSNSENSGTSVTMIGNADGVRIPRQFIDSGKDVFAFLYHVGTDFGRTVYKFRIPNKVRPDRTNEEPTPEEQSVIDQAISALNEAVAQTAQDKADADQSAQSASDDANRAERAKTSAETAQGKAEEAQESAERAKDDAENSERNASESERKAKGYADTASEKADAITGLTATAQTLPDGSSATASYDAETGVMSFGIPKGRDGTDGDDGYSPTANVSKTGKVATITITDKNGTTSAQVEDGTDGTDGIDGISPSVSVTDITGGHRVVITDKDGTESFDVEDGATGATPNLTIGTVETLEPTESATATITGTPENPVLNLGIPQGEQGEVSLADLNTALMDKADIITDTASGSIASFSDGADDLPLKSLVVDINPIQDLHGYDHPWPAGGGKNLFGLKQWLDSLNITYTQQGEKFTITSNGSLYTNPWVFSDTDVEVKFSCKSFTNETATQARIIFLDTGGNIVSSRYADNVLTLNVTASKCRFDWSSGGTFSIEEAQIELGSTVTDYAPYENLCPISGWTQVDVEQRGKNLLKNNATNGSANGVTWTINSDGSILFSGTATATTDITMNRLSAPLVIGKGQMALVSNGGASYNPTITGINFQNDIYVDGTYVSTLQNGNTKRTFSGGLITVGLSRIRIASGTVIPSDTVFYPQIEIGDAPSAYEPYTGRSINIQLGQTVYGAKLYPLEGKAVINMAMVDLGTLSWQRYTSETNIPVFYARIEEMYISGINTALCSMFKAISWETLTNRTDKTVCPHPSLNIIYVADSDYENATEFAGAVSGQQYCYKLANPITYQLTPTEVKSLLGQNNLWADSGDTEVEYRADTKLYIAKKIAEAISALS